MLQNSPDVSQGISQIEGYGCRARLVVGVCYQTVKGSVGQGGGLFISSRRFVLVELHMPLSSTPKKSRLLKGRCRASEWHSCGCFPAVRVGGTNQFWSNRGPGAYLHVVSLLGDPGPSTMTVIAHVQVDGNHAHV